MEGTVLLYIVVTLMLSTGARGQSYSRSCSTVDGVTVCEQQQNQGGMAAASSQAVSGGSNGNYQNAYAGAGNPNDWSSSQTEQGVPPPAGAFPGFGGFGGFGFPNFGGGPAAGSGSSASQSASSSGSGNGNQGGYQQGSSSYSASSSGGGNNQGSYQASSGPGTYTYTSNGNNGGGAFAGSGAYAGSMPMVPMPFMNPMNNPMNPATFNPFSFVFGRR